MAMMFPLPQVGKAGKALLQGLPLMIVPGTWKVLEPQRFGDKLSIGALRYTDFTPYESAQSFAYLSGGYGLRRYSDLADQDRANTMYRESSNVDARFGPAILSAKLTNADVQSTTPVLWSGEWKPTSQPTPLYFVITHNSIEAYIDPVGWFAIALSLANTPVPEAIGVFGDKLIIGFGAAAPAIYTTDGVTSSPLVTDVGALPLYVFAFTEDRANCYIAGGPLVTDVNTIYASTDGAVYQVGSKVTCGGAQSAINELTPGGTVAILIVGKETELGEIDNSGIYRILVPLDTKLPDNCRVLRWWMGSSGDEQRGPMIVLFNRDNAIWAYEPATDLSGRAENISPWADMNLRPPTARGAIIAVHGTARWLYILIRSTDGHSWVIARDARTGASHTVLDLGAVHANTVAVSSLLGGSNPKLLIGTDDGVTTCVLPLDGDIPLDDPDCTYASVGYIDLPDIDLGFPDEDKVLLGLRISCENILAGARYVKVWVSYDGSDYTPFGIVEDNSVEITFNPETDTTVVKRLGVRLVLYTTSETQTPQVLGVSARMSLNTRIYRKWAFQAVIPAGSGPMGIDLLEDPHDKIRDLWIARRAGTAVSFVDRWNDAYQVRILELGESEKYEETDRVAETVIDVTLLEADTGVRTELIYFALSGGSPFLPFVLPWTGLYDSLLSETDTISNSATSVVYPYWLATGPGHYITLTNTITGETFSLDETLAYGEEITIDFDPRRKTVISNTRGDLSASVVLGSLYWGLQPGDNQIAVSMGGTADSSQLQLFRSLPVTY